MPLLSDVALRVQNRLEEEDGGSPPTTGNFWDYTNEIFPIVVEAVNEASMLTGDVLTINQSFTIPASTTYLAMPKNAIAITRVIGPAPIKKYDIFQLDNLLRGWQSMIGAPAIQGWFPLGMTLWGVFPQLQADQRVTLSYLAYPVAETTPYTGNEDLPIQSEYYQSVENYAEHVLRLKEAGQEFEISQQSYQEFLDGMQSLSRLQARRDNLVFSKTMGASVRTNYVESK
jgi:hypothetical protein